MLKSLKKFKNILFIFFIFFAFNIVNAESIGIDLVKQFRYSQNPVFAGDDVRVYITIQNSSGFDASGVVQFYDNDKFLSDSNFWIVNGGKIETWVDWLPTEGDHNLSAKISSLKKLEIAEDPQDINLDIEISVFEKRIIDIDTDKDGIGNQDDLDDDNDGISDEDELKEGMDPLVFNSPINEEKEMSDDERWDFLKEKIFTEDNIEKTKEVSGTIFEKTKIIVENTKEFLEEEKERVDDELDQTKLSEAQNISDKEIIEKENPFIASIIDGIPSIKEIYSFVLGIFVYILNSIWLLFGTIILMFWILIKVFKSKSEDY
ncbi:MAG: Ig-like domain repeat protein [Candidatus Pacebacteria bacterium]|nr:Ig-like domain repeat protein [Candidatus Paceibacterota bacterium]